MGRPPKPWPPKKKFCRENALEGAEEQMRLADQARKEIPTNPLKASLIIADIKIIAGNIRHWMYLAREGEYEE